MSFTVWVYRIIDNKLHTFILGDTTVSDFHFKNVHFLQLKVDVLCSQVSRLFILLKNRKHCRAPQNLQKTEMGQATTVFKYCVYLYSILC